jgi:hypothetical protein
MSSFMAFGSQLISLAEHSHSSFALVVSCLCAGEDLPPPFGSANEGLLVGGLDRCGLDSLLGLTGVGHPRKPTLF